MARASPAQRSSSTPPASDDRRPHFDVDQIASQLILPVIRAAAAVLAAGEFIGRSRCQIDLVGLQHVVLIESQGDHQPVDEWVPTTVDITLTTTDKELRGAALTAARALARSAGLPFWDSAPGVDAV